MSRRDKLLVLVIFGGWAFALGLAHIRNQPKPAPTPVVVEPSIVLRCSYVGTAPSASIYVSRNGTISLSDGRNNWSFYAEGSTTAQVVDRINTSTDFRCQIAEELK